MRALVLESPGEPPTVHEVQRADPAAPPGGAVVRVTAAGFSHHDALIMAGVLRRGVALPFPFGFDVVFLRVVFFESRLLVGMVGFLPGREDRFIDSVFQ